MPDTLHSDPEQLATWLHGTAQGDAAAFRALYDTISPKLFGYALRILGKRELAEEALQDGFVAIWNGAAGYQRHLAAPMTWMTTIVRNKSLDLLRRCAHDLDIDGPVFDAEIMAALQDPRATPIDALIGTGPRCSPTNAFSRNASRMRSAARRASSWSVSGRMIANSSPP